MKLSIIVVTYNEQPHIARLKGSIDAMERPPDIAVETILVDGGSTDGTADTARQCKFDQVIELPGASIPVCRNHGVAASKGEYISFIDGDCELASGWLNAAIPFLRAESSVILGWPAEPPPERTWVQDAWSFHWGNKNPASEEYLGKPVVRIESFRLITTRNMILTRSAFDKIDGFDEVLVTGEDTDFVFRAYHRGITVLGVPGMNVVHYGEPATLRAFFQQQLWHANRSSYEKISCEQGAQAGSNAPRFTKLFLSSATIMFIALITAIVTGNAWWLLGVLPSCIVIGGPALLVSLRGNSLRHFLRLCVLYIAYGTARALDMLGFFRQKESWKSKKKGAQTK